MIFKTVLMPLSFIVSFTSIAAYFLHRMTSFNDVIPKDAKYPVIKSMQKEFQIHPKNDTVSYTGSYYYNLQGRGFLFYYDDTLRGNNPIQCNLDRYVDLLANNQ